jgi:hypothetical protein
MTSPRRHVTGDREDRHIVVFDTRDPAWSADPLRVFGAQVDARAAHSCLGPPLNVTPTSSMGVLLSGVLDADYLQRHQPGGLEALIRHLTAGGEFERLASDAG